MNSNFAQTVQTTKLEAESNRLFSKLQHLSYSKEECMDFARLTLKINELKKQKNAIVLAHNYQVPEILFGIADFIGDSLELSKKAAETNAKLIVFCGVKFMAETAKILNPEKKVLLPSLEAGCSLAESINAKDVMELRKKFPDAAVVSYVNTSAEVKAESNACCTSSNALKIINSMPNKRIIFIPDKYMAANLQKETGKEIIPWNGKCIVHESFNKEDVLSAKCNFPDLKVLAHLECSPSVLESADYAGSTSGMIKFVENSAAENFMPVTECGLSSLLKANNPEKNFVVPCNVCPYMKKNNLENVLKTIEEEQFEINISEKTRLKAKKALDKMMELS